MNKIEKIIKEAEDIETKQLDDTDLDKYIGARIMTFGTFDLFHIGHKKIIDHAKFIAQSNTNLFIGVSSDKWNSKKGKKSQQSQEIRKKYLEEQYPGAVVFFEDHNLPEETWPQLWDEYEIDLIIMGGDHFENLAYINDVVTPVGKNMKISFYERTPKISSTLLRGNN